MNGLKIALDRLPKSLEPLQLRRRRVTRGLGSVLREMQPQEECVELVPQRVMAPDFGPLARGVGSHLCDACRARAMCCGIEHDVVGYHLQAAVGLELGKRLEE